MVYSLDVKLKAIKLCDQGMSVESAARKLGCSRNSIATWIELYKNDGIAGLHRLPHNCRYNFEEKCKIICEFEKKHVPLHVICARYRISRSTISVWLAIVRTKGYDALREIKYGRKTKSMGRPKKKEPETELEKLKRENELLRAENAFLKKLKALMTEKELNTTKQKLLSSNH